MKGTAPPACMHANLHQQKQQNAGCAGCKQLKAVSAPRHTWKALSWCRHGGRRVAHSFMMVASAYTSHFSSQRPPANCSGAM